MRAKFGSEKSFLSIFTLLTSCSFPLADLEEAVLELRKGAEEAAFQENQEFACLELLLRYESSSETKTRARAIAVLENQNQKVVQSYMASLCQFIIDNMLLIRCKEARYEVMNSVETLVFCSKRIHRISALSSVRKQFRRHFGKRFVAKAIENANGTVKDSIVLRLSGKFVTSENIDALLLVVSGKSASSITTDKHTQVPLIAAQHDRHNSKNSHDEAINKISNDQSHRIPFAAVTGLEETKEAPEEWEKLPTAFCASPLSISPSVQIIVEKRNTWKNTVASFSPTLPIYVFQPNPSLEIGFDARTRNPLYVLERLPGTSQHESRPKTRPAFYEDEKLPEEYRSKFHHYFRSGYDRGHMAPAADFGGDQYADTFVMSNISPQVRSMNCSIWAKLENWCRHVAQVEYQNYKGETYVVTGPLWMPKAQESTNKFGYSFPAIGASSKSLVQVPSHFFKVVAVVSDNRICKFGCFIVPNEDSGELGTRSLQEYVASWTDVEAFSGMKFFPNLTSDSGWKEHADSLAQLIGQGERALMRSPSPFRRKNKIVCVESTLEHLVV